MKVVTIVGTRPELIRLSRIISKLDKVFEHTLIHTGQNYDYSLNAVFFEEMNIPKPNFMLSTAGASAAQTIGNVLIETDKILRKILPDAVLLLGDTNSCLAALSAKKLKIPIFHLEAGNRCFDLRVPEETNRKIVDAIADINLTYSSIAREHLISEGFDPQRVIKVGSPMAEVLKYYENQIQNSDVLDKLSLTEGSYFVLSTHREEIIDSDEEFFKLIELIQDLDETCGIPIVFSIHPRTRKKIEQKNIQLGKRVIQSEPLGFFDYCELQKKSRLVISDSGTIFEEASLLGFKAVNLRPTHERPEANEEMPVIVTGLSSEKIIIAERLFNESAGFGKVNDYNVPNVSDKVANIILSFTDLVNSSVWKK